jgi:hypothetical protein
VRVNHLAIKAAIHDAGRRMDSVWDRHDAGEIGDAEAITLALVGAVREAADALHPIERAEFFRVMARAYFKEAEAMKRNGDR